MMHVHITFNIRMHFKVLNYSDVYFILIIVKQLAIFTVQSRTIRMHLKVLYYPDVYSQLDINNKQTKQQY